MRDNRRIARGIAEPAPEVYHFLLRAGQGIGLPLDGVVALIWPQASVRRISLLEHS